MSDLMTTEQIISLLPYWIKNDVDLLREFKDMMIDVLWDIGVSVGHENCHDLGIVKTKDNSDFEGIWVYAINDYTNDNTLLTDKQFLANIEAYIRFSPEYFPKSFERFGVVGLMSVSTFREVSKAASFDELKEWSANIVSATINEGWDMLNNVVTRERPYSVELTSLVNGEVEASIRSFETLEDAKQYKDLL